MSHRSTRQVLALAVLSASLVALAQTSSGPRVPAAIVAAAKKNGQINTIALPPDWANYGEIMARFQSLYGLKLTNASPDASSADELQAVRSLKGQSRAPDVLDVGPAFAIQAVGEKLLAPYKPSTWNSIPATAKDPNGYWVGNYFGVVSIGVNKNLVKNVPKTWADLLKPEYKGQIALTNSPLSSQSAFSAVWAAALANGGSLDNIAPGIEFFAKLRQSGNYIPVGATAATIQNGQTPIVIDWDYLNLARNKALEGKADWTVVVPSEGVYGSFYATAISAYAPNPEAAKLWVEYITSDEGQMMFLKGYAHPIRFNDMVRRKVIPQAMLDSLPDAKVYQNVKFATPDQATKAQDLLKTQWTAKVGG